MTLPIADAMEAFIKRLTMRSSLSQEEVEALRSLPRKSIILPIHQDFVAVSDETHVSYLVAAGVVGRFSQMKNGTRQITALHIPGDMADLCTVVFPKSTWAFQALSKTEVLCIPHHALRILAARYPGIATAFWRDCVVDMAVMSEGLLTLGRRSASARVAHLLCELSCRYRQAGLVADDHFEWQLRQTGMAETLGLTSVHVNRMLRNLREKGLATVTGTRVTIHNFAGLAKLAEFDPEYLHLSSNHECWS